MSGESRTQLAVALAALNLPETQTGMSTTAKAQLDFLLLSLESLSDEGSEAMLAAAKALDLDHLIGDRVTLWRLRNANPFRKSDGGRKKVDLDEVRALVLITCYLARQEQQHIRSTLERLEISVAEERSPLQEPLVSDYLDAFHANYRDRMVDGTKRTQNSISQLALILLVELQFYASRFGPQRLWMALLNRPEFDFPADSASAESPAGDSSPSQIPGEPQEVAVGLADSMPPDRPVSEI